MGYIGGSIKSGHQARRHAVTLQAPGSENTMTLNRSNAGPNGPAPAVAAAQSRRSLMRHCVSAKDSGAVRGPSFRAQILGMFVAAFATVSMAQSAAKTEEAARAASVKREQAALYLRGSGFAAETIQGILSLSDFVAEKQAAGGMAPEEEVFLRPVQPVKPNGAGLAQMIAGGDKLPQKSFFELTQQDTLTADNYAKVVDALYDPADMDLWLIKRDGSAMNAQERADAKESLASGKTRWLKKYAELVNAGQQDMANKWFRVFNTLVQKTIHGSREEFRRGLIAAHSMASYASTAPEKQKIYAPAAVTQAAELVLMLDPAAQLVQVERRFSPAGRERYALQYLMASDAQLARLGFPEGVAATQLALTTWRADQEKKFTSAREVAQIKAETTQIKAETTQIKAETTQIKAETTQIKAETSVIIKQTAYMTPIVALDKEFNNLAEVVINQLNKYPQEKQNVLFVNDLKNNLSRLKSINQQVTDSHRAKFSDVDHREFIEGETQIELRALSEQLISVLSETAQKIGLSLILDQ